MSCFWKDLVQTTCAPTPVIPVVSGTIYSTGSNNDGALGIPAITPPTVLDTFTVVTGETAEILSSGSLHFITKNIANVTRGVGSSTQDQLNDGNFFISDFYIDIDNSVTPVDVACGNVLTLIVNTLGNITAYGDDGFTGDPADASGYWETIDAGTDHYIAKRDNGDYYGIGRNNEGALGLTNFTDPISSYTLIAGASTFIKISCGDGFTLGLTASGDLYGTGRNIEGQLGLGDNTNKNAFTLIGTGYKDMIACSQHSVAVKITGDLLTTGGNSFGQLGTGDLVAKNVFGVRNTGFDKVGTRSPSSGNSFALKASGEMFAAGLNTNGNLGLGDQTNRTSFTSVGTGFLTVCAGSVTTIALK